MRKIYFAFIFSFIISFVKAQAPETFLAPSVWLRADLGRETPALWLDYSGNERHAASSNRQANDYRAEPSKKRLLNYNPVLVFDGTGDYVNVPFNLEGLADFTLFAVFMSDDTTERVVWGLEKSMSRNVLLTTRRAVGPEGAICHYGKNEKVPVLSTLVQQWPKAPEAGDSAYLALGHPGMEEDTLKPFKGVVAEFIVFDKALGFIERLQVETYLSIKYGISLYGKNYVSSDEKVLWRAEDNEAFSSRITAIGRDDGFGLYQKQSTSTLDTTGLMRLSAQALAPSNEENLAKINNGDFLVWGDNGAALTCKRNTDSLLSIVGRKWLMNVTGKTASQMPTELQLDISQLAPDSLGYWLVIDRSGEGDFSADNLDYVLADSVSIDSIAYFSGVRWDTDYSGKDIFSFARARDLFAVVKDIDHPYCLHPGSGAMSIEVLGGSGPYQYKLTGMGMDISRSWEGPDSVRQEELVAGRYALQVRGADNEQVERTFSLKMPDGLTVNLGKDRRLEKGKEKEIQLDASRHIPDSVSVTYHWEGSHGFRSEQAQVSVLESGIYRVTVTNKKGCTFSDEVMISGSLVQKFEVYPTITDKGRFRIAISLEKAGKVTVTVYGLSGNTVHQVRGENSAEYQFYGNIENQGMYMVVLESATGLDTRKLIVN